MCFVRKVHAIQHGNSTKSSAIIIKAMKQSLPCTHNHVILYTLQYLALTPITLHFRPKNLLKRLDTFDIIIYYTSMYVCICVGRPMYVYVYMHACVYACMYVCICSCTHVYKYIYIYALGLNEKDKIRNFD